MQNTPPFAAPITNSKERPSVFFIHAGRGMHKELRRILVFRPGCSRARADSALSAKRRPKLADDFSRFCRPISPTRIKVSSQGQKDVYISYNATLENAKQITQHEVKSTKFRGSFLSDCQQCLEAKFGMSAEKPRRTNSFLTSSYLNS